MLRKILIWICALLCALTSVASAAEYDTSAALDSILAHAMNGASLQQWVDEILAPEAGSGADSYILALNHLGMDYNPAVFARSLAAVLEEGSITNATTRLRAAVTLVSCGGRDMVPAGIADESIGKLGVMSYIYGLHALNSGLPSAQWTSDSVVEKLLSLRKADGGWAVSGNFGDPDVTAMCLQALSCYRGAVDTGAAVEEALAFLSNRQKDSAGYTSYGVECCESACQVLIALTGLGIDPETDARFIKNGNTIIDAILSYRLPSGGYAHADDGVENATAGMQALLAFASLANPVPVYDFAGVKARSFAPSALEKLQDSLGWKLYAWAGIAAFAVLGSLLSLLKKHGRLKRVLGIAILCAIATLAVGMINIQSAGSYYSEETLSNPAGSAYIEIRCDTVAGRASDGTTPEDGVILPRCAIPFEEGDSAFTLLTRAARQYNLQLDHAGSTAGMAYVKAINNLYEYSYGEQSGWMYSLNGEYLSIGCDNCIVHEGDAIVFSYTLDTGEDLRSAQNQSK